MPATRHTLKANTPKRKRMFSHVRESMEKRGFGPGRAIAAASSVVKRDYIKGKRKAKRKATRY
jgi:hypothetical protein